jgi:dienelactone hydrolase
VTYTGADHGFTWLGNPTFNETTAETSWAKILAMFAAAFEQ